MIEVKFRVDDDFTMDELKCVLAYQDFVAAIFSINQSLRDYGKGYIEFGDAIKQIHEATYDLPTLP